MLSSINELIPAGLFPWNKVVLEMRREPKRYMWSLFVESYSTVVATNVRSPVRGAAGEVKSRLLPACEG